MLNLRRTVGALTRQLVPPSSMGNREDTRPVPITRIRPRRWWEFDWRELWARRELLFFFVWRDIKVRYKQTILGASWAILQPFLLMVVFSIFLGKLAKVPSEGLPYPIFAYAALLPWQLFAKGVGDAAQSLVAQRALLTKVYFPRLYIPLAGILGALVDFAVAFTVLLGMMVYFGIFPTWNIMWLPAFLLLAVITALGVGLWLGALNIYYRDVRYIVPFLLQFWMWATPVAYPASLVPERWRWVFGLNPMAGVVEGFRWSLLGSGTGPGPLLLVSTLVALVALVSGLFVFRWVERTAADVV